jgi:hypothetical protein
MNVTCPGCGSRVKNPVCRLAGITPFTHRNQKSDTKPFCSLVVVVEKDFVEPRVILVDTARESIEDVMQRESVMLLAKRAA